MKPSMSANPSPNAQTLPVAHSLLAPEGLLALVAQEYHVGLPRSCRLWVAGHSDVYHVVTDRDRYVLRVGRTAWRTDVAGRIRRRLAKLPAANLDCGLCHGDALGSNAHLDGDGRWLYVRTATDLCPIRTCAPATHPPGGEREPAPRSWARITARWPIRLPLS
jgi:Ser/Thr protein kinase RdoA (MazF antagonist)